MRSERVYGMRVDDPEEGSRKIRIRYFLGIIKRRNRKIESIQAEELPRKSSRVKITVTVPQTNTGRRGEEPQVYERTFVKELGKTAAVISR